MKKPALRRNRALLAFLVFSFIAPSCVDSQPAGGGAKPPAPALPPLGAPPFNLDRRASYPLARPLADPQRCVSRNDVTRPPTITGEAAKDRSKVEALLAAYQGAI